MTPQASLASYPFGGHYEIDIAADGSVAGAREFAKSCLTMKPPKGDDGSGVFLFLTHLLDSQPTEVHVFRQLTSGRQILVFTMPSRITWRIDAGRITPVFALTDPANRR